VKLGLQIPSFSWAGGPAQLGPRLVEIARTAEQVGFDSLSVMDHLFQIRLNGPPEAPMLESSTTLAFLAASTARVKLITVITAAPYRPPGLLAKMVTSLDVLSGGRAWLGLGAGWYEAEARGLGLPFPPLKERFELLEETLQVCLQMWRGDEQPFVGKHYRLERPLNSPQSLSRPHPPIMIGGGGERKTLCLVARYADACNLFPRPNLARKLEVLREHCVAEGRDYASIEKTCIFQFDVGPDGSGVGPLVERLHQLAELGIQTVIGSVANVERLAPLEIIGRDLIPAVAAF
jgi:F420-dependent oxidoreductase-like protein